MLSSIRPEHPFLAELLPSPYFCYLAPQWHLLREQPWSGKAVLLTVFGVLIRTLTKNLHRLLALALSLSLPATFPYREQILDLTFGVVIFSIVVQGLTIKPLLKLANGHNPIAE